MQLQTILNRVHRIKGFVYGAVRYGEWEGDPTLEVEVRARAGSRRICAGCGKKRPGYDRLDPRRFEFLPLWWHRVFLVYRMRRVDCPACGVTVERVP